MKHNIKEYSDQELSLLVFNDKYLYDLRHRSGFLEFIEEYFDYTDEQLEVLKEDIAEDLKELEKEVAESLKDFETID